MVNLKNLSFEKAIRLLVQHAPQSDENTRKPMIPHDIRVGVYLYEHGYSEEVVVAGVLHDMLEFTEVTGEMIRGQFGNHVVEIVRACTKNRSIENSKEREKDLVQRCIDVGLDALIVKAADTLDSFRYYTKTQNEKGLDYCRQNSGFIFELKPKDWNDPIFDELKKF
jgi:(p)ppGpp synthase/HD superfamily hydrolase